MRNSSLWFPFLGDAADAVHVRTAGSQRRGVKRRTVLFSRVEPVRTRPCIQRFWLNQSNSKSDH